jgi:membrane protease YdiL (CAAX protease family)
MVAFPDSTVGRLLFAASKVWLVLLPALWVLRVEKCRMSLSPARQGGWATAILSGLAILGAIVGLFAAFGDAVVDRAFFVGELRRIGLGVPWRYALGATYWILVNSVLEEYVWRWFCVRQCEQLWPRRAAILASALFFTLHHILAMSVYFRATAVALGATGVFIGGVILSAMYVRYRSVWPGYVTHAFADLAIFGLGAYLLFGGA